MIWLPFLQSTLSGLKGLENRKRAIRGLPPLPERLSGSNKRCEPCITKFKEEEVVVKQDVKNTYTTTTPSYFDNPAIFNPQKNDTEFGGGSFGGGGASGDW